MEGADANLKRREGLQIEEEYLNSEVADSEEEKEVVNHLLINLQVLVIDFLFALYFKTHERFGWRVSI